MQAVSRPDRQRWTQLNRRVHRILGALLAVFLATIALSGLLLQLIILVYGDTGPRRAPGESLWVLRARDLAVTLHTVAFTGQAGAYFDAILGLALLFFTVSGFCMYRELYKARARQGRTQWFWWAGKAQVRSLHRWLTLPFGLFAALLSMTGVSLDAYFAWNRQVPLPPVRGAGGGLPGPPSGPPRMPRPPAPGHVWHDLSLSVHKFNFLGPAGHVLGALTGLALLVLTASGMSLFISAYRQRRRAGLTGLLW